MVLPQSALGKAITYTLEQWPALEAFLRDGRIAIDNNRVENAIRPTAICKKNWLFIGEARAGHRGAILYTIVESCRRRGIDPEAYLRDVLTRLPKMTTSQIPEVTASLFLAVTPDVDVRRGASSCGHQRCQSMGAYDIYDRESRDSEAGRPRSRASAGAAARGVAG
ncbi:MAG: transposase [Chthoniobacteraceae bacterium]